ncbi:MAG: relaxase/mobilization nuclease domain-containing protein [Bosea sp. (in: a-proteobacteria)]|uniref:relaxase/mobilization nuclease domain-containing protein n=1 Tax=Bosea sp. (in: a-proteobacteria) TaxID=1871050 RepID=UPI002733E860|nr:relaxase/mobilization nuclease domain-containing protein [Bosea sp. (in: a-proteobacteria)]MDP3602375.1 relaxase/mobilization nuclease domain-containing protein [Bosea sp. (in: a-proteobacteria)]
MIVAKILRSARFADVVNYVLGPDKGVEPGQFEARNIVDVGRAAPEMELLARRNHRAIDPCCHIIVSWSKDEEVTIPRQLMAGRKLLRALGLSDHQALIVPHREPKAGIVPGPNGRHYEMHIIVNRIHPDGHADRMSHSFPRAETAAYRISQEMGFATVPGRFNSIKNKGPKISKPGLGARIGSIKGQTGRATLAEELRDRPGVLDLLRTARKDNWVSLLRAFAAQGIVIARPPADTDAALARAIASAKLVQKYGPKYALKRGLVMMDAADPSRHIKLSSLDCPYEKWGETALVKELGPVPDAMLAAAAPDARRKADAQTTHRETNSELQLGIDPASYRDFAVAEKKAKQALAEQIAADKAKRSEIYNDAKRQREAALAIAQMRRAVLRGFFGRGSLVAAALNALLDQKLVLKLAAIADRRSAALGVLRDAAAKERVVIPRWAEWKRQRLARDNGDIILEYPVRRQPIGLKPGTPSYLRFNTGMPKFPKPVGIGSGPMTNPTPRQMPTLRR